MPILIAFLLICFPAGAQPTNAVQTTKELRQYLQTFMDQPRFADGLWGAKVISLDTGATLFDYHSDRLMSPASNSKLYVGAMALDRFGGDCTIATPLYATRKPNRFGTIHGDLIICGRADPTWNARRLGTNFWDIFEPFCQVLTNAGVRHVTGDLIADATFLRGPSTGSGWTVSDMQEGEGAEVSALTINDNLAQIQIDPASQINQPCRITILQPGTGLVISNGTITATNGSESHISLFHPPGGKIVYVFGSLPLGSAADIEDVAVARPADWFAAALKEALARHGIKISGRMRSIIWPQTADFDPEKLQKLGQVTSPPLREVVRGFMKPSQNLEADLLFEHTGEMTRDTNSPPGKTSEDLAVIALGQFLVKIGAPPGSLFFDEGSGLSRNNLTTAATTVALLQYMSTNQAAADFTDALPLAGVDGTLRRRMKNTPAAGNVRAKTGTLRWANSLSGYVTSAAGERLAFSLMLNRHPPLPGHDNREELDAIAVKLSEFTGRSVEALELSSNAYSSCGELIVTQFQNASFPHPARANGYTYHDRYFPASDHYSNSTVAIFIPKNLDASRKVDLVVHFHGWNNTVAGTLEGYHLVEQFTAAGRNAVLVVPEGPFDVPDSFGGKLEDPGGFQAFLAEVLRTLQARGVIQETNFSDTKIILSGHSGGYHVMSAILNRGDLAANIREVWLFDALYGGTENFLSWQKNENGRLIDIYTDHGGTKDETGRVMAMLTTNGIPILSTEDSQVTPGELQTNRLIFLHSDLPHNDVVAKRSAFQKFLETSFLAPQPNTK